jgi:hypothetical protein
VGTLVAAVGRWVRIVAALATPVAWPGTGCGATYFVRSDGGSALECTGLADASYQGTGIGQPCAWDHPFRALPPGGSPRIAGGDTLVIAGGAYMMGYGAPGDEGCSPDYPWSCTMPALPAGSDSVHPTRLVGAGWDDGCTDPPELWGTERADQIVDLTGSSNVEVRCLEITDRSPCVEFHSGALPCERDSYPFGPWAVRGIYAEDAASVLLADLDIHGLAAAGVQAGRLTDWTVERVRIAGNGWVGWDGDILGNDSNSGTILFRRWTVEWNGCGETYPGGEPAGCWAQEAGGYGDGVGTGETAGAWVIEDSRFLHNTSDGLDLLYARAGSSILIKRTRAEGNAGNQIKTTGPAVIEDSIIVGNCGFFAGKPFTHQVDDCRAQGTAVSFDLGGGERATVTNSTLVSEGDCVLTAECSGTCTGGELVRARNTILLGEVDFLQPFERSCLVYQETFPHGDAVFDLDYLLIGGVKDDACRGDHSLCGLAPDLTNSSSAAFDARPLRGSPAIDAGSTADATATDFDGLARDARPDIGAHEYRELRGTLRRRLRSR